MIGVSLVAHLGATAAGVLIGLTRAVIVQAIFSCGEGGFTLFIEGINAVVTIIVSVVIVIRERIPVLDVLDEILLAV